MVHHEAATSLHGERVILHRAYSLAKFRREHGTTSSPVMEWDLEPDGVFIASVEVKALNRAKLFRDVSAAFADHHVNS